MEVPKRESKAVIDFDYLRAINEFIDKDFLNKSLQSLRGGSINNEKEITTYRLNNTNYLVNLYPDENLKGGKKVLLLDSIFKIPDNFSLFETKSVLKKLEDCSLEDSDNITGGAKRGRPKTKTSSKRSSSKEEKTTKSKSKSGTTSVGRPRKHAEKGGGNENIYEIDYSEVEGLGGKKKSISNKKT